MPFCTFFGLELTPKENDLFFCEKCGTYFETGKHNGIVADFTENEIVIYKDIDSGLSVQ